MKEKPEGSIEFAEGSTNGVTMVVAELQSLNSSASGFRIHQTPTNMIKSGENICQTTGEHFNPLGEFDFIVNTANQGLIVSSDNTLFSIYRW